MSDAEDELAPRFGTPVAGWLRWFAWRPVETVDRGWCWLRLVNCRRIQINPCLNGGADFWFQYAVDIQPNSESEDRWLAEHDAVVLEEAANALSGCIGIQSSNGIGWIPADSLAGAARYLRHLARGPRA